MKIYSGACNVQQFSALIMTETTKKPLLQIGDFYIFQLHSTNGGTI